MLSTKIAPATPRSKSDFTVLFEPGPVGLQLEPVTEEDKNGCRVVRFVDGGPKNPGQARKSGKIQPGDLVVQVDDSKVVSKTYEEIISVLKNTKSKRSITFRSVWDPSILATPTSNQHVKVPPSSVNSTSRTPNHRETRTRGLGSTKKVLKVQTPSANPNDDRSHGAIMTPFSEVESTFLRDPATPAVPNFLNDERNPSPIRHNATHLHDTTIDISMVNSPTQTVLLASVFQDQERHPRLESDTLPLQRSELIGHNKLATVKEKAGVVEPRLQAIQRPTPPASSRQLIMSPPATLSKGPNYNKPRLPMSTPLLSRGGMSTPLYENANRRSSTESPVAEDTSILAAATAYVVREFCGEANPTPLSEGSYSVGSNLKTPRTPYTGRLTSPPLTLDSLTAQVNSSPFSPSGVKKLTTAVKSGKKQPQMLSRVLNKVYKDVAPAVVSSSYAVGSTVAKSIVPAVASSSYSLGSAMTTKIGEAIIGHSADELHKANELKFQLLQELSHAKAALDVQDNERSDLEHSISELFRENVSMREALEKMKGEMETRQVSTNFVLIVG